MGGFFVLNCTHNRVLKNGVTMKKELKIRLAGMMRGNGCKKCNGSPFQKSVAFKCGRVDTVTKRYKGGRQYEKIKIQKVTGDMNN